MGTKATLTPAKSDGNYGCNMRRPLAAPKPPPRHHNPQHTEVPPNTEVWRWTPFLSRALSYRANLP